jgi:hypothetical protein
VVTGCGPEEPAEGLAPESAAPGSTASTTESGVAPAVLALPGPTCHPEARRFVTLSERDQSVTVTLTPTSMTDPCAGHLGFGPGVNQRGVALFVAPREGRWDFFAEGSAVESMHLAHPCDGVEEALACDTRPPNAPPSRCPPPLTTGAFLRAGDALVVPVYGCRGSSARCIVTITARLDDDQGCFARDQPCGEGTVCRPVVGRPDRGACVATAAL